MKEKKQICKNCKHWHNGQAELKYSKIQGICTRHLWTTEQDDVCMVLDRGNVYNISKNCNPCHRFEALEDYGNVENQRYLLIPYEEFGCIFWTDKTKS